MNLYEKRGRNWRVRYLPGTAWEPPGWAIYFRGARMWKKSTLEAALDYIRRNDAVRSVVNGGHI